MYEETTCPRCGAEKLKIQIPPHQRNPECKARAIEKKYLNNGYVKVRHRAHVKKIQKIAPDKIEEKLGGVKKNGRTKKIHYAKKEVYRKSQEMVLPDHWNYINHKKLSETFKYLAVDVRIVNGEKTVRVFEKDSPGTTRKRKFKVRSPEKLIKSTNLENLTTPDKILYTNDGEKFGELVTNIKEVPKEIKKQMTCHLL